MTEKRSILSFGNSLTAGYYCFGLEYHPYAEKLKETIQVLRPNIEITTDVEGRPGDLVTSPGHGRASDDIFYALKKTWSAALSSGAKVLALTIPECAAKVISLDTRRNELNRLILSHTEDRFFAFDLHAEIPYHSAPKEFQEKIFDDGLHLTQRDMI
ncbi:hypothetical protein N7450_001008 [Penicillium hetheringtonii]|uniref:SGNH hydrolase-type esterase domain-containing protein n=1 Tax=Penicillium hetheringtonii TaxID=911720 RepID=A0AAD6H2A3_9EURO|nr:hypothetical protein N7450_001008 [Penicillium hetheringtonii]